MDIYYANHFFKLSRRRCVAVALLLSGFSVGANANTPSKAELYWDDDSRDNAEVVLLESSKPWVIYSQTVPTTALSIGTHKLNLVVVDSEDESSLHYGMSIYVPEMANYDLAGQNNVIVSSTSARSNSSKTNPLSFERGYGSSADGLVWASLSGFSYFDAVDIGERQLTLLADDAYGSENSTMTQPIQINSPRLAGPPTIDVTLARFNGQLMSIDDETVLGALAITSYTMPIAFLDTNTIQVETSDWLGQSLQYGDAYFAFFDDDEDIIDDRFDPDLDNDGLSNDEEVEYGTNPKEKDTDSDGIDDFIEVVNNMDPLDGNDIFYDADNDGLTNGDEIDIGTDVNNPDTDDDGITDGLEVQYGLNPKNQADAAFDLDGDGLSNLDEILAGLAPDNPDSDGDGLSDGVEVANGLDPLDSEDAQGDIDGDGLSNAEEIALGTDLSNQDSDGDGIIDGVEVANGSDPLDVNSFVGTGGTLVALSDIDLDGVSDWLEYAINANSVTVKLIDGVSFSLLANYSISHDYEDAELFMLADRNNDGLDDIGVFGFELSTNRYQLVVHNVTTGAKFGAWNWPATLGEVSFQALDDLTSDGIQEYAISGVHLVNGTRQLVVKDGVTKGAYQTFKWPNLWADTRFVTMTDVTSDAVPEVALYGRHTRLDKGQLFVYDGADANTKVDVYNWNKLWDDIQLFEMDDLDGDGTIDWGQFGQRKDDGRYQWIVKKGHDKRGVIRTFSWPNDLVDVTPMLVADRTGDGIREVAVLGTHPDTGKVFVRINDGRLPNERIANISWPASWEDIQVTELGDLNNDGFSEFGLLGYTKTNRTVQLIVRDGKTTTEYGRYALSGSWEGLSIEHYDIDNDGSDDVVISGINQGDRTVVLTSLKGTDLSLINSQILN